MILLVSMELYSFLESEKVHSNRVEDDFREKVNEENKT